MKMSDQVKQHFEEIKLLDSEFVIIMIASNMKDKNLNKDCKWNLNFAATIDNYMRTSLKGTEERSKHHSTIGNYHGIGVIFKYAIQENISINRFSGNDYNNKHVANVMKTLSSDIQYIMNRQQNAFPLTLFCGFILVNSLMKVTHEFSEECSKLIQILQEAKENINKVSVSNWICEDAETKEFHQEFDSSYTLIATPFWNNDCFTESNTLKGEANFLFKWTSSDVPQSEQRYLPLAMKDGINILFSGFGCYHRQHRINKGTFWNIACYQNTQFYDKLRASIIRLISVDDDP